MNSIPFRHKAAVKKIIHVSWQTPKHIRLQKRSWQFKSNISYPNPQLNTKKTTKN